MFTVRDFLLSKDVRGAPRESVIDMYVDKKGTLSAQGWIFVDLHALHSHIGPALGVQGSM